METLCEDERLSAEELRVKYNPEEYGSGEHPQYSRWDWAQAVAQRSTLRGYWDWVVMRLEGHTHD